MAGTNSLSGRAKVSVCLHSPRDYIGFSYYSWQPLSIYIAIPLSRMYTGMTTELLDRICKNGTRTLHLTITSSLQPSHMNTRPQANPDIMPETQTSTPQNFTSTSQTNASLARHQGDIGLTQEILATLLPFYYTASQLHVQRLLGL